MFKVRFSRLGLAILFVILCALLIAFRDGLAAAHLDGSIAYVSSDAENYYRMYLTLFGDVSLSEAPALVLVGSPILLLKLTDGNLLPIQLAQLVLMILTLKVGTDCFATLRGRIAFIGGALAFPYFLFGFLSLNKEIYAMSSAIFFASYSMRGYGRHLLISLVLAMCARYYMLLALLAMVLVFPRFRPPRYHLVVAMLLGISLAAPFVKMLVPGYSSEGLIEGTTFTSALFSKIIDSFGYALIYPIKYSVLIPARAYSFLIDPTRLANGMEALVSLMSLAMLALAAYLVLLKKPISVGVWRLLLMGAFAPIPIMWTEIMHWRYFSFVYFFFLFAVVLHFVDEPRKAMQAQRDAAHA